MPRAPFHGRRVRLKTRPMAQALRAFGSILGRIFVLVLTIGLTTYGVREMVGVLSLGSITLLQYVFLVLFSILFAWIAFAFAQSILGFFLHLTNRLRGSGGEASVPDIRTALLVPVYNEEPARVAAALAVMAEDLAAHAPGKFDFFILSDTNQPDAWLLEEAVFSQIHADAPRGCPIFYRHRAVNTERKAGNIAEWVRRWGGAYEAMVILDADSLMGASTLMRLAARLEANVDLGLIQSLPGLIRGRSLYARLQQFANRCYGPIYGNGLAFWHGRTSNFWGHNAIIRVRAFAQAARLPELKGTPPFGGHVLSHDFIEAAFLRRAGWGVRLDTDIEGSFEEAPPSLIDVLSRDRRWCQGNLQHGRLLFARGLTWLSRLHLMSGILSYLSSVFWLLLVITGLVLAVNAFYSSPEYFIEPSLFPTWPVFDSERAIKLFILSMAVVLGPKFLGWLAAFLDWRALWGFGGPLILTVSVLWETLLSVLYAPIMMLAQSGHVVSILLGRDTGWRPQRRRDGALPLREIIRFHGWHTLTGLALGVAAWFIHPHLFWWMSPMTAGLVFSIPLSALSGARTPGWFFRTLRLGRTPEESRPPVLLQALEERIAETVRPEPMDAFLRLRTDPELARWHVAQLPEIGEGDRPSDDALVGLAKAQWEGDAQKLGSWLSRAQAMALLSRPEIDAWLAGASVFTPDHPLEDEAAGP